MTNVIPIRIYEPRERAEGFGVIGALNAFGLLIAGGALVLALLFVTNFLVLEVAAILDVLK